VAANKIRNTVLYSGTMYECNPTLSSPVVVAHNLTIHVINDNTTQ